MDWKPKQEKNFCHVASFVSERQRLFNGLYKMNRSTQNVTEEPAMDTLLYVCRNFD